MKCVVLCLTAAIDVFATKLILNLYIDETTVELK